MAEKKGKKKGNKSKMAIVSYLDINHRSLDTILIVGGSSRMRTQQNPVVNVSIRYHSDLLHESFVWHRFLSVHDYLYTIDIILLIIWLQFNHYMKSLWVVMSENRQSGSEALVRTYQKNAGDLEKKLKEEKVRRYYDQDQLDLIYCFLAYDWSVIGICWWCFSGSQGHPCI